LLTHQFALSSFRRGLDEWTICLRFTWPCFRAFVFWFFGFFFDFFRGKKKFKKKNRYHLKIMLEWDDDSFEQLDERQQCLKEMTCSLVCLKEVDEDWQRRAKALASLQTLLADGHMCSRADDRATVAQMIHGALLKQLEDRRSTLCKQACETVAAAARSLGAEFEPCVAQLFEALYKLLSVTVKVMARSADLAALKILEYLPLDGFVGACLRPVAAGLADNHPAVRSRAAAYLYALIDKAAGHESLYEQRALVRQCIARAIGDSAPEVRENARLCYLRYERVDSAATARMFATLDPMTRRQLNKQRSATPVDQPTVRPQSLSGAHRQRRKPVSKAKANVRKVAKGGSFSASSSSSSSSSSSTTTTSSMQRRQAKAASLTSRGATATPQRRRRSVSVSSQSAAPTTSLSKRRSAHLIEDNRRTALSPINVNVAAATARSKSEHKQKPSTESSSAAPFASSARLMERRQRRRTQMRSSRRQHVLPNLQ
jgi:CLIP-associating protein 1/2